MTTITLTLQNVNGDPSVDGGNINITTGTTVDAVFNEQSGSVSLSTVSSNDSVTIDGFTYTYEYLGSGDVRGDESQPAAGIPNFKYPIWMIPRTYSFPVCPALSPVRR